MNKKITLEMIDNTFNEVNSESFTIEYIKDKLETGYIFDMIGEILFYSNGIINRYLPKHKWSKMGLNPTGNWKKVKTEQTLEQTTKYIYDNPHSIKVFYKNEE